jgi:hypothetical protein
MYSREPSCLTCRGIQLLLVEDKQAEDDQRKQDEQEDRDYEHEFG